MRMLCYRKFMQQQLFPLKEKRSEKGFQHISELLPAAVDRILKRAEDPMPDPNDYIACIKWVNDNL